MMYSKIINPKTGRNVTIYGKIGQQILRNYISVLKGGASKCTNYHSDPIKCQASKDESGKYCVYYAAKTKGVVGQCRKSSAKDIEKSKESARRRSALEPKFQESAALRLQKRFKSKKRIDNFANAAEDMQTREKNKKSIAMTAQIDEDMQTREKNKKSLKMADQIAKDLQQSKNQKASALRVKLAQAVFKGADKNGDGSLTKTEIRKYFKAHPNKKSQILGPTFTWKTFFEEMDTNPDGKFDIDEFTAAAKRV